MPFMLTRADVGDYDAWKTIFDADPPGARKAARGYRILRGAENPNEVFIAVEFDSTEDAHAAREKLVASGVLDRLPDHTGPTIAVEAETVGY